MKIDINLHTISNSNFIYEYIPALLQKLIIDKYKAVKNKPIVNYFKKTYKLSITDLIDAVINTLEFNVNSNILTISVNHNKKIKDNKIEVLAKFIDSGNLEYLGIHIFSGAFSWVQANLLGMYAFYTSVKGAANGN